MTVYTVFSNPIPAVCFVADLFIIIYDQGETHYSALTGKATFLMILNILNIIRFCPDSCRKCPAIGIFPNSCCKCPAIGFFPDSCRKCPAIGFCPLFTILIYSKITVGRQAIYTFATLL